MQLTRATALLTNLQLETRNDVMLWIYTSVPGALADFGNQHPGLEILDWSDSTPGELVSQSETVLQHHREMGIYLGYLDGWMLSLTEEIRMRPLIRKFPVCVVSRWPCAFSVAWKNELEYLGVNESNGLSDSNNHGSSGKDAVQDEHGHHSELPTDSAPSPEGGEARSPPTRRKRKGQNQAPSPSN